MQQTQSSWSITPVECQASDPPDPCQGHSMVESKQEGNLLLFGGRLNTPKDAPRVRGRRTYTNNMYRYSLETGKWSRVVPQGNIVPSPRHNHSVVIRESRSTAQEEQMIIYGGSGVDGYLDDVFCYHLGSDTWEKWRSTGNLPGPRHGHTACLLDNDRMIVFGGKVGVQSTVFFNDVYELNLETREWTRLWKKENGKKNVQPSPRCWHSANMISDHEMMIFGGFSFNGRREIYFDDTWIFNLRDNTWTEIKSTDPVPLARNRQTCTLLGENVVLFGGNYLNYGGDKIEDIFLGDIWLFSLSSRKWEPVEQIEGNEPALLRGHHSSTLVGDSIYLFGGEMSLTRYNDMHMIRVLPA